MAASLLPVLSDAQARTLRAIVERVVPGAEVWVFGSRATGRARPFSDVDLLFTRPARLSWAARADLRDAFEASELPFRVDVVDVTGLAPGMAQRIAAEKLALTG
jgi:predicted nucleotidyltransferase